uniref:Uncharacterized protein n=1 Tax=Oryza rufipogon TaxID=4529 RepID=A0A0E0QVL5_ORYRU
MARIQEMHQENTFATLSHRSQPRSYSRYCRCLHPSSSAAGFWGPLGGAVFSLSVCHVKSELLGVVR